MRPVSTTSPVGRRDVLRLLSLATLATTVVACSAEQDPDRAARAVPGRRTGTPVGPGGIELVAADVARTAGDPAAVPSVVAAMHATGGALYGSLAAGESGNLALSPYSVAMALALATNGAVGETRRQLELVFGGADIAEVNGGLNALTTHLESFDGPAKRTGGKRTKVQVDAANALFGQRGFSWGEPFLEALATSYGAGMNVVDWVGQSEAARTAVNAWTATQTHDKIKQILPAGSVDASTRLVLVNTLYLKTPWDRPFNRRTTRDRPFTLLDGRRVEVPLMTSDDPTGDAYAEGDGWAAARLPYAGRGLAMTVVVPDAGRFAEMEQDLVDGGASTYLDALRADAVQVTLPSWTFSFHRSLLEAVGALGVELPFRPDADFSAMTTDDHLFIGTIEHEVFVAVDEGGTEAAAATAVGAQVVSLSIPGRPLVVDRPFLFLVHDVEHGTPLFLGRVVDPRG